VPVSVCSAARSLIFWLLCWLAARSLSNARAGGIPGRSVMMPGLLPAALAIAAIVAASSGSLMVDSFAG